MQRDRHRGRYGQRRIQLSGGPVFAFRAGTGLSAPAAPEDAFDGACLYTRIVGGTVLLQGLYIQLCAVLRSYTLLKEDITVDIVSSDSATICSVCGKALKAASAKVNGKDVAMNEDNRQR